MGIFVTPVYVGLSVYILP